MRGRIFSRTPGSYTIVVDAGKDANGKRKQATVTIRGNKRDAEKRLAEMLHQIDTGNFTKHAKSTVGEYLDRWLTEYAKPNISPRSYERYSGIVHGHLVPAFGNVPLTQLKTEHIQQHYAAKLAAGLNPKTIHAHHAVIHNALRIAVKWGLLSRNVADAVVPPRITRIEMKTWDQAEVSQFLNGVKSSRYYNHYYAAFYTLLYTGMRRGELLGLQWKDIDFILGQIHVNRSLHHLKDGKYVFTSPKSEKSRRSIAMPPSLYTILDAYHKAKKVERSSFGYTLTDGDLVFSTIDGKPIRPNTITRAWEMAAAKCGVKVIRLHDSRHTHASLMLRQGIHPKIVQERLGHSSISMTLDVYSHVTPGLQEAAAKSFDSMLNSPVSSPVPIPA